MASAGALLSCPLCLQGNISNQSYFISLFLDFLQRPLSCPICGFTAASASELSHHLVQHLEPQVKQEDSGRVQHNEKLYTCKQCKGGFSSTDLTEMKLHAESEHPERKFFCNHCCKLFKAQASLTLHLRMAHGGVGTAQHQCTQCDKKFASLGKKQAHEKTHPSTPSSPLLPDHSQPTSPTESEALPCPLCEKTFRKDQHLQQHIRTHEAKKYECTVCKKLFTTKEYLRKHARLHTGETPYNCDQCGKTFTFQQSYHKHLLYHSDERPYSCEYCNRRFKELSTLHNHQRIHTGEKPYSCDTCGKSFRQRVSFVVHKRIHTGALPYVCPTCGKSFRYKVSQRSHKCDSVRSNEADGLNVDNSTDPSEDNIVRQRPMWLERLVTAQQNLETTAELPDSIKTDNVEQVESPVEDLNEIPLNLFDAKSYYEISDSLPSLDLSQLTLSLDSELIFPTS